MTRTEFAEPELSLPTATIVDPSGENLRTEITYESRSTADTFLRQKTKTLPAGTASPTVGDFTTQYDHYAKNASVDNPCTPGVVDLIPQSGLPRLTTDPDPDFAVGGPSSVTNETVYDYPWGRPIATRINGDQWACTTYDTRGRVLTRVDSALRVETYGYAAPSNSDPLVNTYQYTDTGNTVRNTSSAIDLTGRSVRYADELNTIASTDYDRAGRPVATHRQFYGGTKTMLTETHFATNGRVDWTKEYASGTARTTNYSYDSYGRPTTTSLQNGLSTTSAFDANSGAVSSLTHASASGTLSKWNYQRSAAGRITSESGQARTRNFTYDGAGRLTNVAEGSVQRNYKYDRNTNRCANAASCDGTFTYDNADRMTASPYGTSYTYDPHGNTTQIVQSGSTSNAISDSYAFDAGTSVAPHSVPFTVGKSGPISATATMTATSTATLTGSSSPSLPAPNNSDTSYVATPGPAETSASMSWPQSDGTLSSSGTWPLTTASAYNGTVFTPNTNGTAQAMLGWGSLSRTFTEAGPTLTNSTPWTKNYVASANGQFKVYLNWPWQAWNSPNLKLELLDGATVVASSDTSFYGNERESVDYPVSGLSAGQSRTYTVRVTKVGGASTAFTIGNSLLGVASQYPVTPTVNLELRNNATNAVVASGSSFSGSVSVPGAVVSGTAYKFVATTSDNVSASQSQSVPNRAYAPLKFEYRAPNGGAVVWSATSSSGSVSMPSQLTSVVGTYLLQVTNMSTSAASYPASPAVSWTRVLRSTVGKEGSLATSGFNEQTVTPAGNGTVRVDVSWLRNTHDAAFAPVTVEVKSMGGSVLATGSSSSGAASVSYPSGVSGTSYKVVVTNGSSSQTIPLFRTVTGLPANAGIVAKVVNANGDTVLNGNGGPGVVSVAGNLPPGKYQFVSSPGSGAGSVVVAGSFVPRSASVSFGYDLASDHNVWTDDGVTRVTETLAPSGRVLRRIVAPTGGTVGATEDVTYGYDDGGDSPAYSKPTGGGSLTTYLGDAVDTAGVVTYRHFNAHGDVIGTSTIAGVFTERPAPDEYGLETVAPTDRMGWLGKQQRMQTGINNYTRMGVRLYDPAAGRFLSVDPVDGGSANNYDYVNGDPVNDYDLGGTFSFKKLVRGAKKFYKRHKSSINLAVAIVGGLGCHVCVAVGAISAGVNAYNGYRAFKKSGDIGSLALGLADVALVGYGSKLRGLENSLKPSIKAMSAKAARLGRRGKSYSKAATLATYEDALDTIKLKNATMGAYGGVMSQRDQ